MPDKLPYLNLGCGTHYHTSWTNVDFVKTGAGVMPHNLLEGIPFTDESFEVVYHSNVLEHFLKEDAVQFIQECKRVLKPGGILRIAIPDLERIATGYLNLLQQLKKDPDNKYLQACYDWVMLEMFDQTVRNTSGGNMVGYLQQNRLINEDFVIERCGDEVGELIRYLQMERPVNPVRTNQPSLKQKIKNIPAKLKRKSLQYLLGPEGIKALELGKFRLGGEIHFWMYDSYSLTKLLKENGFNQVEQFTAVESRVPGWNEFKLETAGGQTRKPDSIFIEAIKQ